VSSVENRLAARLLVRLLIVLIFGSFLTMELTFPSCQAVCRKRHSQPALMLQVA
jgi:hypothetical protein